MRWLLFILLIGVLGRSDQAQAKQYSDPELHTLMKSFASTCDPHDRQLIDRYLVSVRQLDRTIDSILIATKNESFAITLYVVEPQTDIVALPARSGLIVNTTTSDVEHNNLTTSYYNEPLVQDVLELLASRAPKDTWGWPMETRLRKLAHIQQARAVVTAALMGMQQYGQRKAVIIIARKHLRTYETAARNFGVSVTRGE